MLHTIPLDDRWRPRLYLALATVVAYATSLVGPFQFDDAEVILRYAPVQSLSTWWSSAGHGLRPVLKLTYALNGSLGWGPAGFHLFNLALHLANVEMVLRLVQAGAEGERPSSMRVDRSAFVAGALFALHPIQTEAITYISGRSSSLMTFFTLAAMCLYVEGARTGSTRLSCGVAPLAFLAAVLTKETAGTLPAGLLLWELLLERPRARGFFVRQGVFWTLLFAIASLAIMKTSYFSLLYHVLGSRPLVDAFRYQLGGIWYLASRLVLVDRLSIDPGLGLYPPSNGALAAGGALLIILVATAVRQARRRPLVAFGASWFVLQAFLPYVLFPRMDVVNERHMYLASVGVFAAIGALWNELAQRLWSAARHRAISDRFGALILVALGAATVRRNLDYRSATTLWESTVRASPLNPRTYNNLGVCYETTARYAEARTAYARAIELEPRYQTARQNLERVSDGAAER